MLELQHTSIQSVFLNHRGLCVVEIILYLAFLLHVQRITFVITNFLTT